MADNSRKLPCSQRLPPTIQPTNHAASSPVAHPIQPPPATFTSSTVKRLGRTSSISELHRPRSMYKPSFRAQPSYFTMTLVCSPRPIGPEHTCYREIRSAYWTAPTLRLYSSDVVIVRSLRPSITSARRSWGELNPTETHVGSHPVPGRAYCKHCFLLTSLVPYAKCTTSRASRHGLTWASAV